MNSLDEFRGLYPVSRTLKFRLVPQGETLEHLRQTDIISDESSLRGRSDELKSAIDLLHHRLIDDSLRSVDMDWQPLADSYTAPVAVRRRLAAQYRERIAELFGRHPDYRNLTAATPVKLMKEQLPALLGAGNPLIKSMKGKATSLVPFQTMRSHLYRADELHGTVAYRVVDENFPIFLRIAGLYDYLSRSDLKDVISGVELPAAAGGLTLEKVLSVGNFSNVLTYDGIAAVNAVCAALNKALAADYKHRIRFPKLKKLPLSDLVSDTEDREEIASDEELVASVCGCARDLECQFREIISCCGTSDSLDLAARKGIAACARLSGLLESVSAKTGGRYRLQKDGVAVETIKAAMDEVLGSIRGCRRSSASVLRDGNTQTDDVVLRELIGELSRFNRTYGRVKDYLTRKSFSTGKYRLYFRNPQFGSGWSDSAFAVKGSMLARHGGRFYLVALNARGCRTMEKLSTELLRPVQYPDGSCDLFSAPVWERLSYKSLDAGKQILRLMFPTEKTQDGGKTLRADVADPEIVRLYPHVAAKEHVFKVSLSRWFSKFAFLSNNLNIKYIRNFSIKHLGFLFRKISVDETV